MEFVKSFFKKKIFGRWLKGVMIGFFCIWIVLVFVFKMLRFFVVGYDKYFVVIRWNMEFFIGWFYYYKFVMGDGSLIDLWGRVSVFDI